MIIRAALLALIIRAALLALVSIAPGMAAAFGLELPAGAAMTLNTAAADACYRVPVAPFAGGPIETVEARGTLAQQAWRVPGESFATSKVAEPLRESLLANGFELLLDCADEECGGFDFRYGIDLLPEPEMHVDLGDFRFLSAKRMRPDESAEFVVLMISRSPMSGFVQFTHVAPPGDDGASGAVVTSTRAPDNPVLPAPTDADIGTLLESVGRAPLEDLTFGTGSAKLERTDYASLNELALWLKTHPDSTVALVGHTDSAGSARTNLNLSRQRARSVLEVLVGEYGIPRAQLESDGVGYLMPRASNRTAEGRLKNRRVEVILTSTQ